MYLFANQIPKGNNSKSVCKGLALFVGATWHKHCAVYYSSLLHMCTLCREGAFLYPFRTMVMNVLKVQLISNWMKSKSVII